jgi:plasmid stability protein
MPRQTRINELAPDDRAFRVLPIGREKASDVRRVSLVSPCGGLSRLGDCEIIVINDLTQFRMAGNLHVRNLDDDLIARLKRRAARHGRSTEAEHREIFRQALSGDVEPSFDTLQVLLREGRQETSPWLSRKNASLLQRTNASCGSSIRADNTRVVVAQFR